ncbi:hypothetical protein LL967_07820 [Xanthomonas campestris pv. zinniae]|nr:hypothetical protein [Xanthomonas campestris pv. zinniae]
MSYEYTIQIGSKNAHELMQNLEKVIINFELKYFYRNAQLLIKDPLIASSWNYDVSIKNNENGVYHIALVGWSVLLYEVFHVVLMDQFYEIYDDDTDEKITLKELFRI